MAMHSGVPTTFRAAVHGRLAMDGSNKSLDGGGTDYAGNLIRITANGADILYGYGDTVDTSGIPLADGQSVWIPLCKLSLIYCNAASGYVNWEVFQG